MSLRDSFLQPPALDHPTPFWFWNDELDPSEVKRQLGEMLDRKMGGAFLHARMGRVTPYMGEQWMRCVAAALEVARQRGGHAWIYDEDNWPSGYGGGAVCDLGRDYLQKYVRARLEAIPEDRVVVATAPVLAVYTGTAVDERTLHVVRQPYTASEGDGERRIDLTKAPGDTALICWVEVHDVPRYFSPECGVVGYVDVMDPKVTDAFLELIYKRYHDRFGADFGQAMPGFFFDEPSYLERDWGSAELRRPWTAALPELYTRRTGRDLLDDLPSLFFDTGDPAYVRYHFHHCAAELFTSNFTRRIADWCARHNVQLTGHVILEEHLRAATQTIGNPLAHYAASHVPGIDHLGKDLDLPGAFWSASRVLTKQVASVAHQLGRQRVMCETFAGGGWDFGVLEQKWMGDFLAVLGVTLICQHACHYSLRGYRKRDYPPSLSFQQPWWPHSAGLNQHFGRLGHLLGQGRHQTNIAVLHPMGSFFATHDPRSIDPQPDPLQDCFKGLTDALVEAQLDFDFIDEDLLRDHGEVKDGKLRVGHAAYTVVLIPHLLTIQSATIELLRALIGAGGKVAAFRPFPMRVDGAIDDKAAVLFRQVHDLGAWSSETLAAALDWTREHGKPGLRLCARPPAPVFVQHRATDDEDVFVLCADTREPFEVDVEFMVETHAVPRRWETHSDAITPLDGWREAGVWRVRVPFARGRSHVIVFPRRDDGLRPPPPITVGRSFQVFAPGTPVAAHRLAPNALALDRCRVRVGDSDDWLPLTLCLHVAHRAERSSYAGGKLSGEGLRPGQRAVLRFTAKSDLLIEGAQLAMETPEVFAISVNGQPLAAAPTGWFIDTSLKTLPLPPLPPGDIVIDLAVDYDGTQEFETLYLLGEFNVTFRQGEPALTAPRAALAVGDWTAQGLPFYAGRVRLETNFPLDEAPAGGARLRCDAVRHTAAVTVNDIFCGYWLWPPYTLDVGHALRAGDNKISLEVANSLRNFYGPHHLKDEDGIDCLGPMEILTRSHTDIPYQFKPAGLLAPVYLELLRG